MRPEGLQTKIFLDSGDPAETREAIKLLGFLDGQTTNPSLVAKNPETAGKKFTKPEIFDFYKKVVTEVSGLIPDGSVSIEVYADMDTTADQMLEQRRNHRGRTFSQRTDAREYDPGVFARPGRRGPCRDQRCQDRAGVSLAICRPA